MSLIRFQLNTLACHRRGGAGSWRKTSPYMWNIFFKLCHPHLLVDQQFSLEGKAIFHFSEGSHGNLGVGHIDAGTVVPIPQAIGLWQGEAESIKMPFFNYEHPGIVGCICALMEKRNVSGKGAEAGHQALNNYVKTSMNQAIRNFNVKEVDVKDIEPSIKRYIDREVGTFTHGIERRVGGAVMQAQSLMQNVWSLLDQDELIGFHIWHFNRAELEEHKNGIPISARWATQEHGDWEVKGLVEAL